MHVLSNYSFHARQQEVQKEKWSVQRLLAGQDS